MPFPEPLPHLNDCIDNGQHAHRFQHIDEINGAVVQIIEDLSRCGEYTGVGRIQTELFRV